MAMEKVQMIIKIAYLGQNEDPIVQWTPIFNWNRYCPGDKTESNVHIRRRMERVWDWP